MDAPKERRWAAEDERVVRPLPKPGVLVVDDDHLVLVMVRLGLEGDGFEVWAASNGPEALDVYWRNKERIDVVLLDVRMPGLDGPHTLDALRELNPQVVACFMSGDVGAYGPEELIRRGAAHVIAKPFTLDQLATLLRPLVNGSSTEQFASTGGGPG
jgi:CheY-like chemotaxis protein